MDQPPIFIFGAHKSGTSLLRSIFDGHPSIISIPFETHIFQMLGYWVNNEYRKQEPVYSSTSQIIQNFQQRIQKINRHQDPYGGSHSKGLLNEEVFKQEINRIRSTDSEKEIIEKYLKAISIALNFDYDFSESRIVEKSVEQAEFAPILQHHFPKCHFIHVMRNPYATTVSLRKYKVLSYKFPLIHRLLRTLDNSYYYLFKNKNYLPNYHVIQYEKLITNPENELKALCKKVDLCWNDCLLYPTILSRPWKGNSTSRGQFTSINNSNMDAWKDSIHPMEIYYVNKMFPFIFNEYGYQKINLNGNYWRPAKSESITRYLANRIYRYYLID